MVFKGTSKYGTSDWEKEKVILKQISDLYEKQKADMDFESLKQLGEVKELGLEELFGY